VKKEEREATFTQNKQEEHDERGKEEATKKTRGETQIDKGAGKT
jgi:hypothetical protein